MTVMLSVLSNNEHYTYSILREKSGSRHDTATVGQRIVLRETKGVGYPKSAIWESLLGQRKRGGYKPHISLSTLVYESAKHRRISPQCLSRGGRPHQRGRKSSVDLLHLTRRLGKPNLLPHRVNTVGIFFAVRPRPRAADFFISTQSQ